MVGTVLCVFVLPTNAVVSRLVGDRILPRSRAKRIESPVTGWLAVALTSECKGTTEGQQRIGRFITIYRCTLTIPY